MPGEGRRLAPAEWGLTVAAEAAGGQPLDIGLRLSDGLVRAQAFAVPAAGAPEPSLLLRWNRQTRLVRFGSARSGDVWVHADLPARALDERGLDRLLGLLTEAALAARAQMARRFR